MEEILNHIYFHLIPTQVLNLKTSKLKENNNVHFTRSSIRIISENLLWDEFSNLVMWKRSQCYSNYGFEVGRGNIARWILN